MNKIKILLIVFLFLLTGCSCSYEIEIDDTIKEKISFSDDVSIIKSYSSVDDYVSNILDEINKDGKYNNYKIVTDYDNNYLVGLGKKSYSDFNSLKKKSVVFNDLFSNFDYNKGINTAFLELSINDLSSYFSDSEFYTSFVDELKIVIKTPGNIISGNYDELNNNSATWILNKDKAVSSICIEYNLNRDYTAVFIVIGVLFGIFIWILFTYIKYKKERRIL